MKTIFTDKAPAAVGPYSQAKVVGGLLFASGQIPLNPATGSIVEGGIVEQTEQVCKNIDAVLAEAGSDFSEVIKTTCFLADIADFKAFNEVIQKAKPATAKGTYVTSLTITTTQGPGIKVDVNSL